MIAQIFSLTTNPLSEELLRNPQAMRVILDAADIPINYCSLEKRFLFVNKTYADWYGRTPEQIIGTSLVDLLGEEGFRGIQPYVERVLNGEQFRYETGVNLSIGFRYMQCSYTPVFDKEGSVSGWVGIIYDMTQRHLLEKSLRESEAALKLAKERAEAANVAKSEFLANMSHEIRTPMNAVIGLAHILNMSEPLTTKQQEIISTLQLSAKSLLSLLNDLLDFTKMEANNIDLENIPFRFSAMIEELILMYSIEAQEKNIVLTYERHPEDNALFMGDPLRIRQILTNLIGNAIKFTPKGSVTVKLSRTPSSEPNHIYTHISVRDTGIGIPAHKQAAVFDKFIQADMSITRQYGGSGLGLAISKNLAELMGGSITLKSKLGEGSEFILHLPLEYAEEIIGISHTELPQHERKAILPAAHRQIKILLAEDHRANILVATTLLDEMGYQCDVAQNGKEVLAKLTMHKHNYDIILMDIQMPELDGYLTTRLLREEERKQSTDRIPIIGVTAHAMRSDIQKCLESGMDDYISKPFSPEDLKRKIENLIFGSRKPS